MQLYLLDTNMVSYILNGRSPAARTYLDNLPPDHVACVSTISEGELRYGLAKSGSVRKNILLTAFLKRMPVEPWTSAAAAVYGQLRMELEQAGNVPGPVDMQIGAHAIALGATLVTRDKAFRHISRLPGLENWATDLK